MTNQEINSIPIIVMTAHAFREDVENCKEAGMNDYFSNPLDIQKILSVIAKYRKKDDNDWIIKKKMVLFNCKDCDYWIRQDLRLFFYTIWGLFMCCDSYGYII